MPNEIDVAQPGQHPTASQLVNVPKLITAYYALKPDAAVPAERVSFGTSGHRGSAFKTAFNEDHIAAITQAICDYRNGGIKETGDTEQSVTGPLFLAQDTHALVGACLCHGARSARRKWHRDDD